MPDREVPPDLAERALRVASAGAVGASVAHELRNALAVADSSLFLARRDVDDRDRLLKHLDKVSGEIRRAQQVIGAVLGLARGEAVNLEPTPVAALLDAARRSVVLPTNVTLSVAVDPPDLVIVVNAVLLERVLSNLYLNAIEALASRGRGAIATRVTKGDTRVTFTVDDDGPGIDPTLAVSAFDPLITTKPTGMGLGLALCRAVVLAHGGEISATRGPLGGARFEFSLPL
jgi:signal transduction histidine kinase